MISLRNQDLSFHTKQHLIKKVIHLPCFWKFPSLPIVNTSKHQTMSFFAKSGVSLWFTAEGRITFLRNSNGLNFLKASLTVEGPFTTEIKQCRSTKSEYFRQQFALQNELECPARKRGLFICVYV